MNMAQIQKTVLVVDDEINVRRALARLLSSNDYRLIFAADGIEGLQQVTDNDLDLIISDARMPGMDGITFLSRAAEIQPNTAQILLTGTADVEMLQGAVNQCQLAKFITKPWVAGELIATVDAVLAQHADLQKADEYKNYLLTQLEVAADLQRKQIPLSSLHEGINIDWIYKPCAVLAGDGIGFKQVGDQLFFYLLDVVGHGPAAAMESYALQKQLADLCEAEPEKVAERLNQAQFSRHNPLQYFTMIYGVLNVQTGRLQLCQAGHPHPLHWSRTENRVRMIGEGGFPVGLIETASYTSIELQLQPGDRMLFCSDGLLDAGVGTVVFLTEHSADLELAGLLDKIVGWREILPVEDDISMLALECKP
jgi:sigma-B regulation protein RsbU (phosphoserine phosphatase)